MNRSKALKVLLAIAGISHLILGAIAYVAPAGPLAAMAHRFYGASVEVTPQLQHVIHILGAYMLAVAVLSWFAFRNPAENKSIVLGIVVLLVLRVLQRLIFAAHVHEHFSISYTQLIAQSVFFLAIALGLFFLRPRSEVKT